MKSVNKKTKLFLGISMAVSAFFALETAAEAAAITGSISFSGNTTIFDGATSLTTNLLGATKVDFAPLNQYVGQNTQSGSFNLVTSPTTGIANFANVVFLPSFAFTNPTLPISPLWSVGDFTFTLTSWTDTVAANSIQILGTGILHDTVANTLTDSTGKFNFSTQPGGTSQLTFSASSQSVAPLPAAIFFVAPALAGLFGFSRRKASAGSMA